jgi:hypothetical protein
LWGNLLEGKRLITLRFSCRQHGHDRALLQILGDGDTALAALTQAMADSWHRDWDNLPSWDAAAVAQAAGCSNAFVHNLLAQAVTVGSDVKSRTPIHA